MNRERDNVLCITVWGDTLMKRIIIFGVCGIVALLLVYIVIEINQSSSSTSIKIVSKKIMEVCDTRDISWIPNNRDVRPDLTAPL